jgi:hypothetical protein
MGRYQMQLMICLMVMATLVTAMVYPIDTEKRTLKSLDGIWAFKADLKVHSMIKIHSANRTFINIDMTFGLSSFPWVVTK